MASQAVMHRHMYDEAVLRRHDLGSHVIAGGYHMYDKAVLLRHDLGSHVVAGGYASPYV